MPWPPATSRDFHKAAGQRLATAEFLLAEGYNLDAMYLGGYVIECSLKALILELTSAADRPTMLKEISSGSKMHRPEVLKELLKQKGGVIEPELVKRLRRFDWSTDLRYQYGRTDTGETRALLKTARAVHDWVKGKLP